MEETQNALDSIACEIGGTEIPRPALVGPFVRHSKGAVSLRLSVYRARASPPYCMLASKMKCGTGPSYF